jgi:hypothetical protein
MTGRKYIRLMRIADAILHQISPQSSVKQLAIPMTTSSRFVTFLRYLPTDKNEICNFRRGIWI